MLHVGNGDKDTKKTSKGKTHWYFDLLDIMVDRASANAKTTSDELLDSDKDDISSNLSSSSSSEKKQQNKRHLSIAKKTKTEQKETKTSIGGHKVGDHDDDYYDDYDLLRPNYMNLIEELNNKKAQQYEEQIRHNQVMEDAVMWKAQNDKLEYKVNLIKKYGELKELGLSKAQIAKHFPEMMHLIEDDDDEDGDDDDDADVDA
jgi:hypothetical protein